MFMIRLMASSFEFILGVAMSVCVIYVTYRVFIKANPDFDMEEEIEKGNIATGLLVSTILICASVFLGKGMESVVHMFRLYATSQARSPIPLWEMGLLGLGHLVVAMLMAILTISITLRLFARLTPYMHLGQQLQKGNIAVGLLLSSVVIIATFYVAGGVSSLSKALTPQPTIGRIEIAK